jgi:hypothetical protein
MTDCREILGVDVVNCGNLIGAARAVLRNAPSYPRSLRSKGSIMCWESYPSTHIILGVSMVLWNPPPNLEY